MKNSKVSVIIPCYNGEKYIDRVIHMLLNQTLKELEIVIVNDGSKDGSSQKAHRYSESNSSIIVIDKTNEGPFLARKTGTEAASGEYVIYLDIDDTIEDSMYSEMYRMAKDRNADVVVANYISKIGPFCLKNHYAAKPGYYDNDRLTDEILPGLLFDKNAGGPNLTSTMCVKLIKKEIAKKSFEGVTFPLRMNDDQFQTLSTFRFAKSCYIMDRYFYYYIFHRHSVMTSYKPNLVKDFLYTHNIIYRNLAKDFPVIENQINGHLCLDICFAIRNLGKLRTTYTKHKSLMLEMYENQEIRDAITTENIQYLPPASKKVGEKYIQGKIRSLALCNFLCGLFNFIN